AGLIVMLLVPPVASGGLMSATMIIACGFGYVAVVNAVNFMDGINGISAAQGMVGGTAYALVGLVAGQSSLLSIGTVTAAAMAAFAPFNVPRPWVFLGDTGSYGMGAALAGLAVLALSSGLPVATAIGPL